MKVAHIFKSLNPGGIETWLKDLSYIENNELHFLLQDDRPGLYDNEVINNNVIIKSIPLRNGVLKYSYRLMKLFRANKYDVVHCHVNLSSGWILFLAYLCGIKKRVAHCHNDKRKEYSKKGFLKKCYFGLMKSFVDIFSNEKISVSESAIGSMYYAGRHVDIIPCGLSFKRDKKLLRTEFGLAENDFVLCHIGRFVEQKNHAFLIDIMEVIDDRNIKLLLIGEGQLRGEIINRVDNKGLKDNVLFLGLRNDINSFLYDIVDMFLLPSHFEGLGLVAIEAQYNRVYSLVSACIPSEVKISEHIEFLDIDDPSIWAKRIIEIKNANAHIVNDNKLFNNEKFMIESNMKLINDVYNRGM